MAAEETAPGTAGSAAPGTSGGTAPGTADGAAPAVRRPSWKKIGPGVVVAATGVGAGDLVATLVAGSKFGYTLLWAAVIGCIVKIALAEATGRWHLATGRTIFDGWRGLGAWTTVYFAGYVVIWGFVYGATAMSSSALPLQALFPDALPLKAWAVLTGLVGLLFVWTNRYAVVEKIMMAFVGVMFLVVVYVAIRVSPDLGDALAGLVPVLPSGSLIYTLGLIGGVGGTITMAAYGYWINAKGWADSSWMDADDAARQPRRLPDDRHLRRRHADHRRRTAALLAPGARLRRQRGCSTSNPSWRSASAAPPPRSS